jgi:hypothetical protein
MARLRSGIETLHPAMRDAGLVINITLRYKTHALVESDRMTLGREAQSIDRIPATDGHEGEKNLTAHAQTACRLQYSHSPNPAFGRNSACTDRFAIEKSQNMPRFGVMIIHLDFFGHRLLDYENRFSNSENQFTIFRKTRGNNVNLSHNNVPGVSSIK